MSGSIRKSIRGRADTEPLCAACGRLASTCAADVANCAPAEPRCKVCGEPEDFGHEDDGDDHPGNADHGFEPEEPGHG